ncbi:hypothetical protein QBC39DRAFT_263860 [Podospora conica]|nr:hypothetical protein QBC39DRAFT_263860 [Schizothecium conicum]
MAGVYGSAYVTIAATHSQDCQAGIFATRASSATLYRVWPLAPGQNPVEVDVLRDGEIYARRGLRPEVSTPPLQKRGWALQEHVLSRRVIQYAEWELRWQCRTGRATESQPTLIKSTRRSGDKVRQLEPAFLPQRGMDEVDKATVLLLGNLWADIVKEYSQRKLAHGSDKLYAVLGVADALSRSGMGPYHAGVFERDLLMGLTWYSKRHCPEDSKWRPTHERPKTYRAPSWSWASIDGKIAWLLKDRSEFYESVGQPAHCKVVRMSDTELVLRGKVIPGALTGHSTCLPRNHEDNAGNVTDTMAGYTSRGGVSELQLAHSGVDSELFTHTDIVDTTLMHPGIDPPFGLPKLPLDVICLLLGARDIPLYSPEVIARYGNKRGLPMSCVLVLTRSSASPGAYERVGINSHFFSSSFEGAEELEVTIV